MPALSIYTTRLKKLHCLILKKILSEAVSSGLLQMGFSSEAAKICKNRILPSFHPGLTFGGVILPHMRAKIIFVFALYLFVLTNSGFALGELQYVETVPSTGSFPIVQNNSAASLLLDTNDFPGVVIAANNLRTDISRVSGLVPEMVNASNPGRSPIIIGTLGKSALIDQLVGAGKIDVSPIQGKWESFLVQVVPQPMPEIGRAHV